jgi:hypothetical protein
MGCPQASQQCTPTCTPVLHAAHVSVGRMPHARQIEPGGMLVLIWGTLHATLLWTPAYGGAVHTDSVGSGMLQALDTPEHDGCL